ncbi:MAG: hypothetical protein ACYC64_06855 [Armatimonadota bacterium]
MKRGAWHQFGDRSQKLAQEQLEQGVGVGVIISARDISCNNAAKYAIQYHGLSADVLFDPQFYVPEFQNANLQSYGMDACRVSVTQLHQLSDSNASILAATLERIGRELQIDALISPALPYEAGRPDIVRLNHQLFNIAKKVGDSIGVPTYATVAFGQSVTGSNQTMGTALSAATALPCDGWYYAFEFTPARIPSDDGLVFRCCTAGLTLACTGKPVLHAFAGPMGLLSLGFGATGAGIGHSQNVWHFTRSRWQQQSGQGGGGDAPPRYFSKSLWGTIVYPDETVLLPLSLRRQIFTESPFDMNVRAGLDWDRWTANKHFVHIIGSTVGAIAGEHNAEACARTAIALLQHSLDLHQNIQHHFGQTGLRDNTTAYQNSWRISMDRILSEKADDYSFLAMLR